MGNKISKRNKTVDLSKLLLIISIIILSSEYAVAQIQWEKITPPEIGDVEAITLTNEGNLLIGALLGGIYESSDNGQNWITISDQDFPKFILELAVTNNGSIICGTQTPNNYRSTDDGRTWEKLQVGCDIFSIAINSKGWIYMGNGDCFPELYRSKNDGSDWEKIYMRGGFHSYVGEIVITPDDDIYIASFGNDPYNTPYLSVNDGENFTSLNIQKYSYGLTINSNHEIYLGDYWGNVYHSSDNGYEWDSTKISNSFVYCMITDKNNNVYAGTKNDGILLLDYSNSKWQKWNEGIDTTVSVIWELKIYNDFLYAGTDEGVYCRSLYLPTDLERITIPFKFVLNQNYPNPFNPATTIEYTIPAVADANFASTTSVQLVIYNILGQEVATLVDEQQRPGNYKVNFNASGLSSGVYYYRLTADNYASTRKMIVLR